MHRAIHRGLGVLAILSMLLALFPAAAFANPPAPDPQPAGPQPTTDTVVSKSLLKVKPVDQPNPLDKARIRERQRLLDAGLTTQANALAQTGTDRVLVLLVEFAGTDVFTWTPGSTWDPLGIADPNEWAGSAGDCSKIITQTQQFTYTSLLHNELPRPLSAADRSGDSIWTEDFSPQWFADFMFGNGITFNYTRTDGSPVYEDFTGKSVKNFYLDMSDGLYTIDGDVIGWITVPHSYMWYGADQCPGARSVPSGYSASSDGAIPGAGSARSLVRDALDAVNAISNTIPGFSWTNYDLNGDGVIDRLWIVHSGYGEEDSTTLLNRTAYGESSIWSHSSSVSPPYPVGEGISAGPYIIMPENGGIGVFAHEYGHNLGADDLYAYGIGETSAGFWTTMADDWTGYPIGFLPPPMDPWHLDNWGWLNPYVITDTSKVYTVTLGQASNFPGGAGVYRGAKIKLADQQIALPISPIGNYQWWGGNLNQNNAMMTTASTVSLAGAVSPTLVYSSAYGIETEWDFLWVQVSTDGGTTWQTITNTNTTCTHDPAWIGGLNGFPDDLCAAGLGGFTGYNAASSAGAMTYENETFDLSPFIGQNIKLRFWYMTDWGTVYQGPFIDNVTIVDGSNVLFSDGAESGDANWVYANGWNRYGASYNVSHNYYLQWRNVSATGGYDFALADPRWRFGPANTGLLVWYNNNAYVDNEVGNYLTDDPGFGPKGRMLVIDAHPDPYRDPYWVENGYNNEGGNVIHRSLMRDAPFSLLNSVNFTMSSPYAYTTTAFTGRPAVSAFHDSIGYYPGAEYVRRGPAYPLDQFRWVTKQWDASAVVPAKSLYGVKAPGYVGTGGTTDQEFRFDCSRYPGGYLSCYWFGSKTGLGYNGGSGNPGDISAQYGWHAQILSQTAQTATVKIWNASKAFEDQLAATPGSVVSGGQVNYTYHFAQNAGSPVNAVVLIPLDTTKVEYVPGSAVGLVPMPTGMTSDQIAAAYAAGGKAAVERMASTQSGPIAALAWFAGQLGTGQGSLDGAFSVRVKATGPAQITMAAKGYDGATLIQTTQANVVQVLRSIYLPLVTRQ